MRRAPKGLIANPVMMLALVYFFSNLHSFFAINFRAGNFHRLIDKSFDDSVVYAAGIAACIVFVVVVVL